MLLRSYLEAADLWKDDHPREVRYLLFKNFHNINFYYLQNPHAKFILLATVQTDKIEPGFEQETPKQIFKTLEERFCPY